MVQSRLDSICSGWRKGSSHASCNRCVGTDSVSGMEKDKRKQKEMWERMRTKESSNRINTHTHTWVTNKQTTTTNDASTHASACLSHDRFDDGWRESLQTRSDWRCRLPRRLHVSRGVLGSGSGWFTRRRRLCLQRLAGRRVRAIRGHRGDRLQLAASRYSRCAIHAR